MEIFLLIIAHLVGILFLETLQKLKPIVTFT